MVANISSVDIEKATADLKQKLKPPPPPFPPSYDGGSASGITQIEAAKGLGCSRTTIAAYENGTSKIPRYSALACAAIIARLLPLE